MAVNQSELGWYGENMKKANSIKKNLVYQMLYQLLILALPLLTSPYIARVIGAEGLGRYSYSYSIANYFVLFSMLGIQNYGSRVIAQTRDDHNELNRSFSNLLAIHVAVSILCLACYMLYFMMVKTDRILVLIQGAYVLSALFDISWFYFGLEEFKITVIQSTAVKIANAICIFTLVKDADDLWKYCALMAVGLLLGQMVLWVPLCKFVHMVRPCIHEVKKHIKPLFILFVPVVAISLYKCMDKIMLGVISSKEQLGFYENAERIINVPVSLIAAFGLVLLPRMSNLIKNENRSIAGKYISVSMRYVMCLAIAFAFGMAGVGQVFAPVFWGGGFRQSGVLIMYLASTIPFLGFANVIRTQYLIPEEKDREYLISVIMGAVVNLGINWTLIPSLGAVGAAVGTIAAEITVCVIQTFFVRKKLNVGTYLKESIPFLGIGSLMFSAVYCVGQLGESLQTLLLQVASGIIVYAVGCCIYFYIKRDAMFMRMFQIGKRRQGKIKL